QRPFPDAWVLYARSVRRRAASFLRAIRKQPDRGTVRLPGQLVSACPDSLAHHPKCALSSETRASHRLPIIPPQQSVSVWVCRRVGCVGSLREFLWRSLPERVLERGYTAYM